MTRRNYSGQLFAMPRIANVASSSPLTSGTLFTYTGTIRIDAIIGTVTTAVQNQATNCKLSITPDSLSAYDFATNLDLDDFDAGSILSCTGTAAALVGTDAQGPSRQGRPIRYSLPASPAGRSRSRLVRHRPGPLTGKFSGRRYLRTQRLSSVPEWHRKAM